MGMSASQARYLGLVARQNDLEYQGQQINQERTILSQQVTDLYNMLQNLKVPTPPSTSEYTKVQYTGTIGASSYTFDASSIKPDSNGTYKLSLSESKYGNSLTQNNGYSTVNAGGGGTITGTEYTSKTYVFANNNKTEDYVPTGNYKKAEKSSSKNKKFAVADPSEYEKLTPTDIKNTYFLEIGGKYVPASEENRKNYSGQFFRIAKDDDKETFEVEEETELQVTENKANDPMPISASDISSFYVNENGVYRKARTTDFNSLNTATGVQYQLKENVTYLKTGVGNTTVQIKGATTTAVGGGSTMTLANALATGQITQDQYDGYVDAINNSGITKADGTACKPDEFYIIFNGDKISFALISDVDDGNNNAITYSYLANGKYEKNKEIENCELTFDASNGRITSISIPNYDENGEMISRTTMEVSAKEVTDELAYKDAFTKYEYDKYLYDKEQQEINAKTEVIQQQDKKLELKLQRLDNERTQITTELEAVKKVINDNIEGSYKTFSG